MEPIIINNIKVSSPVFGGEKPIREKYTCDGQKVNPPLKITNIPVGTQSLAIILDDPDPLSQTFVHWVVWAIVPGETIDEDSVPGVEGTNSSEQIGYVAPCPPGGTTHHYHFKVYALDTKITLESGAVKEMLLEAMNGHILGSGELIGLYGREN